MLFLKYGRDDERQSDDLGLRYMSKSGYETREMPRVFTMLGAVSAKAGAGRVPAYLSSHPDPGDRAVRATKLIAERAYPQGEVGGPSYVDRLDGLAFGTDPRQGFFEGNAFYHPGLQFQVRFPEGWKIANEATRVAAINPESNALVQLEIVQVPSPEAAAQQFASSEGISVLGQGREKVGGLDAARVDFSAARQDGTQLVGREVFVAHGGRVFSLLGVAMQDAMAQNQDAIVGAVGSFAKLTDPARLNVQPQRIEVVHLPREMSFDEFLKSYPSNADRDTMALVNGVGDGAATLPAGRAMKRIVGGVAKSGR
jgi:predicted Zn-dependent protease